MCQSSLVDGKAEKITKGLSDNKKKIKTIRRKSKTLGMVDMDVVIVPSATFFPVLQITHRLLRLNHWQQPPIGTPRPTLASRIPSPHASSI